MQNDYCSLFMVESLMLLLSGHTSIKGLCIKSDVEFTGLIHDFCQLYSTTINHYSYSLSSVSSRVQMCEVHSSCPDDSWHNSLDHLTVWLQGLFELGLGVGYALGPSLGGVMYEVNDKCSWLYDLFSYSSGCGNCLLTLSACVRGIVCCVCLSFSVLSHSS